MIRCSAQPELPPSVDADIENCADFREAAASSGARASTPPSVPLRQKLGAHLPRLVESYEDGDSEGFRLEGAVGHFMVISNDGREVQC